MKKLIFLIVSVVMIAGCKVVTKNKLVNESISIVIDTTNTFISNGYLSIGATIVNNSEDSILLLKPKESLNQKIDYFSIDLNQGNTDRCAVETFEIQRSNKFAYRFSNDFVNIAPNEQLEINLNGRVYDQLIYCDDSRVIELQLIYNATRFNGENSSTISEHYVNSKNKHILEKSIDSFSSLYEKEIKSNVAKFVPVRR